MATNFNLLSFNISNLSRERELRTAVDSKYQELQEDTSGCNPWHGDLHSRKPKGDHLSEVVTALLHLAIELSSIFFVQRFQQLLLLDVYLQDSYAPSLAEFLLCNSSHFDPPNHLSYIHI